MQLVPATAAVTARVRCALWANSRHIQVTPRTFKATAVLDADAVCVECLAPYVKQACKRARTARSTNSAAENGPPTFRAAAPRFPLHHNPRRLVGGKYGAWCTTRTMKVTCTSSTDTTTSLCAGTLHMTTPPNLWGVMNQVHSSLLCLPPCQRHSFLLRLTHTRVSSTPDSPLTLFSGRICRRRGHKRWLQQVLLRKYCAFWESAPVTRLR